MPSRKTSKTVDSATPELIDMLTNYPEGRICRSSFDDYPRIWKW